MAVNNMQSAVCEDVLSYDLEYDAVVRVDDKGQPDGIFVVATNLDDAQNRKDFCWLGEDEEALNVGFVFNKISPDDEDNEICDTLVNGVVYFHHDSSYTGQLATATTGKRMRKIDPIETVF